MSCSKAAAAVGGCLQDATGVPFDILQRRRCPRCGQFVGQGPVPNGTGQEAHICPAQGDVIQVREQYEEVPFTDSFEENVDPPLVTSRDDDLVTCPLCEGMQVLEDGGTCVECGGSGLVWRSEVDEGFGYDGGALSWTERSRALSCTGQYREFGLFPPWEQMTFGRSSGSRVRFRADPVDTGLVLGSVPGSEVAITELGALGITAVLDVREEGEGEPSGSLLENFAYQRIPTRDSFYGGVPTVEWLSDCVEQIEEWEKQGHTVYVHCSMGKGRSPLVCMAYLVKARGMRLARAIHRVCDRRAHADPNVYQLAVLCEYVKGVVPNPPCPGPPWECEERTARSQRSFDEWLT